MQILTFEPKSDFLKKYIKAFYIIEQKEDKINDFLIFPSIYPNLSFSKFTKTEIKDNLIITKRIQEPIFETFLISNNNKPLHNKYIGEIYELSISFKPLAINYFLQDNLKFYVQSNNNFKNLNDEFENSISKFLDFKKPKDTVKVIENYLISLYHPMNVSFLDNVISDMLLSKGNFEINELTKKYNISRQTLNTYFQKYLCRSAIEAKKVIRFRAASEFFFQDTLTELSYEKNYFDQSHFIKDFKSLTGFTPKQFFSRLKLTGGTHLVWV